MFIDRLIDAILEKGNPTVVGLDPKVEYVPDFIVQRFIKESDSIIEAYGKSIFEFNKRIIDSIYDIVPCVKPQLAYYEMYGIPGLIAFEETCKYAKSKGLIVIADGKRNDIGTTSKAYADAYLGKGDGFGFSADALTVNPYLGIDGIKPFIENCVANGKGIFILVKTSNKSSGQLQDLTLSNGKTLYEVVAELVDEWSKDVIGSKGYSSVGAVVGATYPKQAENLRKIMKNSYFLVPGYGAQGGSAEDAAINFNPDGLGAIVNSSRGIICAYKSDKWKDKYDEESFDLAARAAALHMKEDLLSSIGGFGNA